MTSLVMRGGGLTHRYVARHRLFVLLPVIALIIGGLAIVFTQATGHSFSEVLLSGQDQLPGLVSGAGSWSLAALAWLVVFKGLAYRLPLGAYRGGPTFPALFRGAAAGLMTSHLPAFPMQAGIAASMGAAFVAVLRLLLSAVVIATLRTVHASDHVEPLIIVGVVVSYIVSLLVSKRLTQSVTPASPVSTGPTL